MKKFLVNIFVILLSATLLSGPAGAASKSKAVSRTFDLHGIVKGKPNASMLVLSIGSGNLDRLTKAGINVAAGSEIGIGVPKKTVFRPKGQKFAVLQTGQPVNVRGTAVRRGSKVTFKASRVTITGQAAAANQPAELSGTLRLGGSTTVLPIAQAAAEQFMRIHPKVRVEVQGTGSSEGIIGVGGGTLDIGDSSRELKPEELNLGLVDHKVAIDVVAFVVHPSNPVIDIHRDQVKDVLAGRLATWNGVGGKTEKIQVIGRDEASGTREFVQKEILGKDNFVADALALPGTGQLKAAVASTPTAFGYMSLGQVDNTVKVLKMNHIMPSFDTVESKQYPFYRNLHMFTKGEATGLSKAFIDFVQSREFQTKTVAQEFLPIVK